MMSWFQAVATGLVTLFVGVDAFMPSSYGTIETDYTHFLITERAIHIAAAEYIETYLQGLPPIPHNRTDYIHAQTTIQKFFGTDRHSLELYNSAVKQIVYGNNNAQGQFGNDAKYTMNAEQIQEGNLYLQNKRDSIIMESKSSSPDWNFVRLSIGEYLMTLQMFYSNTNWIELKGQTVNTALGIRGKTMIPVAPNDMATCTDCNYNVQALQNGSCENNLINNGEYLTSGYKGGQGISKPQGLWLGNAGKCSHGGSWDDTQSLTATGGINKETSDPSKSPHFHLHNQAGEAAIEATVYFLIGSDNGLLKMIGAGLFGDLLSLHAPCFNCLSKNHSITFVIDDTGSMSPIIDGVIKSCIQIINQAEAVGGAAFYTLVTFNDPVPVSSKISTPDIKLIRQLLYDIRVHGGGDCPEFAMQGLLQGIEMSAPGSCLFFFTDADPKDSVEYGSRVVQAAREKDIHIFFFLKGDCNGALTGDNSTNLKCVRKNHTDIGGRRKRSSGGWGTYSSIISSTASSAVNVPAGAITKTIGDTIDVNTGISFTYIANISMSVTGDVFRFPIDNRIVYFTVEIDHENSQSNIKLLRPSGTVENFLTSAATIDIVRYTTVLSIKNPVVGMWELQKLGGSIWRVIVKGKGDISFDSQLLVEKGGIPFPMSDSSPVTGSNVIIGVTVKDIHDNSSVNKIILRSDKNEIVKEFDLGNTNKNVVHAKLFIPPQAFRITIEGSDSDGNVYRRTARNLITPVNAKIDFLSVNRGLIKGIAETVQVIVSNEGSSDDTFYVVATDTENFLQTPKQVSVFVSAHNSSVVEFKILGTRNGLTKLKVELKKRSRILQSKSEYLMVHKSTPPIITTTNQTPACTEELMNSVNCSFGTWFMETSVKCTQPCVDIHITSPIVSLSPVTLNKTGSVTANISGDCCSAESKLVAVDSLSNVAELSIDFSGGHKFETIETTTTISKNGPPNLVVVGESKACELKYMNSENCTNMNWWAEVNIQFQAVANAIYASPNRSDIGNGSFAVIKHDDLKSMKKSIHANVSGSCCLYKISLFAQDNTGQLSMHQLDFSGGVQFQQIVSGNDVKEKLSSAPSLVLIVVITACIVSVGILALIVMHLYRINREVSFEDHVGFKNEMKQHADKCGPVKFRH